MKSISSIRNVCSAEQNTPAPGRVIITADCIFTFIGNSLDRTKVVGVQVVENAALHHSSQSCRRVNVVGLYGFSKSINVFFVSAKIIAGLET